jgi:hypothetical protein
MVPLGTRKPVEGGCTAMYLHLGIDEEFVGRARPRRSSCGCTRG